MKKEEVWSVVRVTHRGTLAHVEMGNRPTDGVNDNVHGPTIKVAVEDAPRVGERIRLTYSWGEDYAAPVTRLRQDGTD